MEDILEDDLRQKHQAYHALVLDGGRPSHPPDDSRFGILDEPGEYAEIISYWRAFCTKSGRAILQAQRWQWQKFREHQDRVRALYAKPKVFEKHRQFVSEHRKKKGLQSHVCLL